MTKRYEEAMAERVDECIGQARQWLASLDDISTRHDHWLRFRVMYDQLTPRRQREVMRGIFSQIQLQFAEEAAEEIIHGGAPDSDVVHPACWVCDRYLLTDGERQLGVCSTHYSWNSSPTT